jgi:protein-L-isoaspartate(D-aspartate) O-methyltransferase
MSDFEADRRRMVQHQLRARGIRDERVLDAMARVRREWFVPSECQPMAYGDSSLEIGQGQTISQPYIVALMTEALQLGGGERVLEIGTGSGYQTAVLVELGAEVYTVERLRMLSLRARAALDALGYERIHFRVDDGTLGWPEEAPFDRIIVTAMAPSLPAPLFAQLSPHGRLVIPIGSTEHQILYAITKSNGEPHSQPLCGCVFVRLIGSDGWQSE